MHSITIAITGTLLFTASCTLTEEDAFNTDEQASLVASPDQGELTISLPDELDPSTSASERDDRDHDDRWSKWICVARYRDCRHHDRHLDSVPLAGGELASHDDRDDCRGRDCDDDHDDDIDFEPCDTEYYYATDRDRRGARREAIQDCKHDNRHDSWKCEIVDCHRQ